MKYSDTLSIKVVTPKINKKLKSLMIPSAIIENILCFVIQEILFEEFSLLMAFCKASETGQVDVMNVTFLILAEKPGRWKVNKCSERKGLGWSLMQYNIDTT